MEVYQQPGQPSAPHAGAVWIDTDAPPYAGGTVVGEWVENVRTYGASGSGVADDTVAVQAAITAGAASGRRVYFPQGVYIISASLVIRSGTYLFGDSAARSIIRLKASMPTNVDMIVALNDTGRDMTFENLTVDGNLTTQVHTLYTTCFHLLNVTNLRIIDCNIIGSTIDGLYLYRCTNPWIIRVTASGNGYWREDASGMNIDACQRALIHGCMADNNGFHGILLSATQDSVVRDCWARGNGYDGMRMQWSADRNLIERFSADSNFRGLYLLHESLDNRVSYCELSHNQTNGLLVASSYANLLLFNRMEGNAEYGIATVEGNEWNYGWGNAYRDNTLGQVYLEPGSSFDPASGTGFGT
jgi:parallel beta-helix repeat protein